MLTLLLITGFSITGQIVINVSNPLIKLVRGMFFITFKSYYLYAAFLHYPFFKYYTETLNILFLKYM